MSEVKLGSGLRRPDRVATDAARADELGNHFVGAGEHVFFQGPVNGGLILSEAAARRPHTRLMSTITLVPLYPAALLAKQVATLDVVSGGRFHLGTRRRREFGPELEYDGLGALADGDHLYLRVTQLDGARAWSSPFWVGE